MNFSRSLVAIISIFTLSVMASGCIYSPSQDEVGLKKMQMEMQSSSLGSEEDADVEDEADIDAEDRDAEEKAEISKVEDDADSSSRTTPPLERTRPIKPIGGREAIPLSIGDILISPYPQPVETAVTVGQYYWQQFGASSDMDGLFNWTVTGLPAGLFHSIGASYNQEVTIEGNPTVAGSYPITVGVAQLGYYEEYSYTLVVAGEEEEEEEEDPCSEQLKIKLVDIGDGWNICPEGYTGQENCYDPATDALIVTVGTERLMKFQVTGDKAPFTWTIQSKVKDSYHCHMQMPMAFSHPYSEKFTGMLMDPENADACPVAAKMFSEWTENYTWEPLDGVMQPEDGECQELPPTSLEPSKKIVDTDGRTLRLEGEFIYDGPLPVSGSSSTKPQEILTVSVAGSCQGNSDSTVALTFDLDYPDDKGKKMEVEIDYMNLKTYGSGPHVKTQLYAMDPVDGEKVVGSVDISLAGEPGCGDDECELEDKIDWENDDFGPKDITDVKVHLGLGWSNCSQPFNPFAGCWSSSCDCSEYGDMDIRDIDLKTKYWKLSYDDQDEGDDQIKKNNHSDDYIITNKPGVKFKRRPFPSSFKDKWEDWEPWSY
ncbi:MAG: hypothetical protein WC683_19605 [bacterium]